MINIGIFSGRFDPPNAGHFMTIERLISEYHFLLVPILDYEGREGCTARQAQDIFEHHFGMIIPKMLSNRVKFIINKIHFGKITPTELHDLLEENNILHGQVKHVYLAGNEEVLVNVKQTGMECKFVPRVTIESVEDQYLFESTKIRDEMKRTGQDLNEIYNLKSKT